MPKGGNLKKTIQKNDTKGKLAHKKGTDAKHSLSRGQRKRLAKREQFLKREKMIMSSLRLKKMDDDKGRIDGFGSVKEALPETGGREHRSDDNMIDSTTKASTPPPKSNRAKQSLAQIEISHMGLVLQHPSFQEDPFATMQQHLRNTLAGQAEQLEEEATLQRKELEKKTAEAKEAKKERLREYRFARNKKGRSMRGRK